MGSKIEQLEKRIAYLEKRLSELVQSHIDMVNELNKKANKPVLVNGKPVVQNHDLKSIFEPNKAKKVLRVKFKGKILK